jgi:hypothetical protein
MLLLIIDTYGIDGTDVDTAAQVLSGYLQVNFELASNDVWGTAYRARSEDRQEIWTLMGNFNEVEQEWREPDFQQLPLILIVEVRTRASRRARIDEMVAPLKKFNSLKIVFIRREEEPD